MPWWGKGSVPSPAPPTRLRGDSAPPAASASRALTVFPLSFPRPRPVWVSTCLPACLPAWGVGRAWGQAAVRGHICGADEPRMGAGSRGASRGQGVWEWEWPEPSLRWKGQDRDRERRRPSPHLPGDQAQWLFLSQGLPDRWDTESSGCSPPTPSLLGPGGLPCGDAAACVWVLRACRGPSQAQGPRLSPEARGGRCWSAPAAFSPGLSVAPRGGGAGSWQLPSPPPATSPRRAMGAVSKLPSLEVALQAQPAGPVLPSTPRSQGSLLPLA